MASEGSKGSVKLSFVGWVGSFGTMMNLHRIAAINAKKPAQPMIGAFLPSKNLFEIVPTPEVRMKLVNC